MTLFDEAGRVDPAITLTGCPHGKDYESCPRCALRQTELDARAPERKPYASETVDRVPQLNAYERRCAEFDAKEDEKAGISPVLVGGRK